MRAWNVIVIVWLGSMLPRTPEPQVSVGPVPPEGFVVGRGEVRQRDRGRAGLVGPVRGERIHHAHGVDVELVGLDVQRIGHSVAPAALETTTGFVDLSTVRTRSIQSPGLGSTV